MFMAGRSLQHTRPAPLTTTWKGVIDPEAKPSLSGTWTRQEGQTKIEFSGKDVMKIYPHGDNKVIAVVCEYTAEKKPDQDVKDQLRTRRRQRRRSGGQLHHVGLTGLAFKAALSESLGYRVQIPLRGIHVALED